MWKYIWILATVMIILGACQPTTDLIPGEWNYFPQSVASGDPHRESVLLWTRALPPLPADSLELLWQIALDSFFQQAVDSGKVAARNTDNFCAKVIAEGLSPGTTYYYRFAIDSIFSPVGRTKTLPATTDQIVLGLVNCGKYEGGYFHAYRALADMEVDAVVHLGDYIYENPAVFPESYEASVAQTGRKHQPAHEIISLEDYRTRFEQYRTDPDLQRLHERHPMINIWDDHEFANDSWRDGAQGHDEGEGDWEVRKRNALQAYFEWIPIRGKKSEPIYRQFNFGELVNVQMLDARICCREGMVQDSDSLASSEYHILGEQQLDWLLNGIEETAAVWNLIGNQVMFSIPKPEAISPDKWGGYPKDRKRLFQFMSAQLERNIVLITGDSHAAFDFSIQDTSGRVIAQEFLLGSVTSTNTDERALGDTLEIQRIRAEWEQLRGTGLQWFDLEGHGFMTLQFSRDQLEANWYRVSTILEPEFELVKAYSRTVYSWKE